MPRAQSRRRDNLPRGAPVLKRIGAMGRLGRRSNRRRATPPYELPQNFESRLAPCTTGSRRCAMKIQVFALFAALAAVTPLLVGCGEDDYDREAAYPQTIGY